MMGERIEDKKKIHFFPPNANFQLFDSLLLPFLLLTTRALNRAATALPFPPDSLGAFRHWRSTRDTDVQHPLGQLSNKSDLFVF